MFTVAALAVVTPISLMVSESSQAVEPISLGTANDYAVFAGAALNNVGSTTVEGDIGVIAAATNAGVTLTGTLKTTALGSTELGLAKTDLQTAYDSVNALASTGTAVVSGTLTPGVYTAGAALAITGPIVLDAGSDANAVFVFQIGAALSTAAMATITIINGGSAQNVYWQVAGGVDLGAGSTFVGTLLATGAISAGAGANVTGRLASIDAAVALDSNTIDNGVLAADTLKATQDAAQASADAAQTFADAAQTYADAAQTSAEAARAAADGGFVALTGATRMLDSLRLVFEESNPTNVIALLADWGALTAIQPGLSVDPARMRAAWALLEVDARDADRVALGLGLLAAELADAKAWLSEGGLDRASLRSALAAADAVALQSRLAGCSAADVDAACARVPIEGVVAAGGTEAADYLARLRHMTLAVDGEDVRGVMGAEGPAIGRALIELRRARIEGDVADNRDAQLAWLASH